MNSERSETIIQRPLRDHTCSPAACACEDLGSRIPVPHRALVESLSALTDEEVASVFELLASSRAERDLSAAFADPEAA